MQTKNYLKYIVEEIHSTVFATVDKNGHPVTCAIDIMDYDESGLYFLTATGKNFYRRLKNNENIAFTAMKGEDTLSCVAVSVQGKVKEIGPDKIPELFRKNPYMEKFIRMYAPVVFSSFSKYMRALVNGLILPNFPLNETAFLLA